MIDRITIAIATYLAWLVLVPACASARQSDEPINAPSPPTPDVEAAKTGESEQDAPALTADETIRQADEALDALAAGATGDERTAAAKVANDAILHLQSVDPGNPWLRYIRGRLLSEADRTFDAIDELQAFVATRDGATQWKAHQVLGDLYLKRNFARQARSSYRLADELKPSEPVVLFGLSRCASTLAQKDKAIEFAQRAVVADGRRGLRYVNHLASMLMADGQVGEAHKEALFALQLTLADLRNDQKSRALLLATRRQYTLLIEIGKATVLADRDQPEFYARLADYIEANGQLNYTLSLHDALATVERGLAIAGENRSLEFRLRRAILFGKLRWKEEAVAMFDEVIELDPDNEVAINWLLRLSSNTAGDEQPTAEPIPTGESVPTGDGERPTDIP